MFLNRNNSITFEVKDFSKKSKNPDEIKQLRSARKVIGNYTWFIIPGIDVERPSEFSFYLHCNSNQAK